MDFSLLRQEHAWLREELAYSQKWYYYFAIVSDGVLRLSWTLNVSLAASGISSGNSVFFLFEPDIWLCVTGLLECFRRFIWNFFRLENEHLNNAGKFRAIRDISLKPIRKGALDTLMSKVEDEDGVTHRGNELLAAKAMNKEHKKVKLGGMIEGMVKITHRMNHHQHHQHPKKRLSDSALNGGHLNQAMVDEVPPPAKTQLDKEK